ADADPSTFFHFLTLASAAFTRRTRLPVPVPEVLGDLPAFARRYFRAFYQRLPLGTVIVLDNFQDAECEALLQIVESAIDEAPAGFAVLVISREPAARSLARAVGRGILQSIPPESLRFSKEEVRLLTQGRQDVDDLAEVLYEESEGWISGIT